MDFSHSLGSMSSLTQRILARRLRRELLRRNQGLRREIKAIDDRTLLRQWFLQSFLERERLSRETLSLRARVARSVHVDGEVVALLPGDGIVESVNSTGSQFPFPRVSVLARGFFLLWECD
jgi:hypothetical protein